MKMAKKKSAIGQKISTIMKEGVRRSTKKPVSKTNPRRKVAQKQAVAIALSMARKGALGESAKRLSKKKGYGKA
jgi:hypothetical protein